MCLDDIVVATEPFSLEQQAALINAWCAAIAYARLAGDLESLVANIVQSHDECGYFETHAAEDAWDYARRVARGRSHIYRRTTLRWNAEADCIDVVSSRQPLREREYILLCYDLTFADFTSFAERLAKAVAGKFGYVMRSASTDECEILQVAASAVPRHGS